MKNSLKFVAKDPIEKRGNIGSDIGLLPNRRLTLFETMMVELLDAISYRWVPI